MIKKLVNKRFVAIALVIAVTSFFVIKKIQNDKNPLTTTIKQGTVSETLVISGEITADKHAQLRFETSGKLKVINVKEGDHVTKGQFLAQLDTQNLNSDFQNARSDLRDKEATLERVYDDVKDSSADETFTEKESRTTAEVAKDKAYENFLKAKRNLEGASLFAPFEGIVTSVANKYPGMFVLATETQIEIVDPSTISFELTADQTEVVNIKTGQEVQITLDSFPNKQIQGNVKVISITPKTQEIGTVYSVQVDLGNTNPDGVRIGMTGDASFILNKKNNVLWVPPRYIKSDQNGKYLNLEKGKVYIQSGLEGEDRVEIMGKIQKGDTVLD